MPTAKENRFTSYDFTPEELKSASVFNPLQKMWVQTQIANTAMQMMNLDAGTKDDLESFEIQRSFLKGQIAILEYLLEVSAAAEINIREEEEVNNTVIHRNNSQFEESSPNLYQMFRDANSDQDSQLNHQQ